MINALKRAAKIELDNIRHPDVQFAWIVITTSVVGITIWALVKS